jgi:hypothetical protein
MSKSLSISSKAIVLNTGESLSSYDPMRIDLSQPVEEVRRFVVSIDQAASDQQLDIGLLDFARYLIIKSDVSLGLKLNGAGQDAIYGTEFMFFNSDARTIHVTNKGLIYDCGVVTAAGASTLSDSSKSWAYTTLTGGITIENFDMTDMSFWLDVNGHLDLIELSGADQTGTQVAAAIQAGIDSSAIGSGQVTVSWDATNKRFVFVNDKIGANPISISANKLDNYTLINLGLYAPNEVLGDVTMEGMTVEVLTGTGVGESNTVSATFTSTQLTMDGAWGTQPVAGDEYRIYKPQAGTIEVLAAR